MKGVVLVVFVLSQEAGEPATRAFEDAALEVLGPSARVEVQRVAEDLPDSEVVKRVTDAGGDAAIELSWGPQRSTVKMHCFLVGERRWVERSISFGREDDDRERGRMLGFAAASMFSMAASKPVSEEASPSESFTSTEPSSEPETAPEEPKESEMVSPPLMATADPRDSEAEDSDVSEWSKAPATAAFDFAVVFSTGVQGEADALGAEAAYRFVMTGPVWGRVAVGGRTGAIPAAQANTNTVHGGAGVSWSLLEPQSRFDLSLRADLLASWLQVARASAEKANVVRKNRWMFGGATVLSGGVHLSPATLVFAGLGAELMFGKTEIYTQGVHVATIPPLRALGEVGIRSSF